ncbi:hypothetical protein KKE14_01990 [Patescibacteria group bacterium]|nr:hypothetical protein [Patescibacteria group bacterium]
MDESRTILNGSRYADGSVPSGNWNDDKLHVNKYSSDNANDNLRAREIVSPARDIYE